MKNSAEYKALQEAVDNAEKDISALRSILANPSMRATREQQEQEKRATTNASILVPAVTAGASAAIIKSEKDERAMYNRAYRQFFKTGETRDVVTSATTGQAPTPHMFADEFVTTLQQISPVSQLVKSIKTDRHAVVPSSRQSFRT